MNELSAVEDPNDEWSRGVPLRSGSNAWGLMQTTPETAGFWDGVSKDALRLKHCPACGTYNHPKRIMCTQCMGVDLAWMTVPGFGSVYSFSTIAPAPSAVNEAQQKTLGIVVLDQGVALFAQIDTSAGNPLSIGSRGKFDFRFIHDRKLPVFVTV